MKKIGLFTVNGDSLIIHKDNLDAAVREITNKGCEWLSDECWMGCFASLNRVGTMLTISIVVSRLAESDEDIVNPEDECHIVDFSADLFKDMDAKGYLTFKMNLVQSMPLGEGHRYETVEESLCECFGLSMAS